MNTQEFVNKIEQLPSHLIDKRVVIAKDSVLELAKQLDDRPKVKIPQFVAEWYKITLESGLNPLEDFVNIILTMGRYEGRNLNYNYDTGMYKWIKETPDAIQIVANMHQFGYEVEQEKRYRVKMKNVILDSCLLKKTPVGMYFGDSAEAYDGQIVGFTKRELEQAGFDGVFDNSMFEVEEVG